MRILSYIFLFSLVLVGTRSKAQRNFEPGPTRILFIYDASNSMNGKWQSGVKHDIAHRLLAQTLDSLKDSEVEMALRVYGHQTSLRYGQDCDDTKLEVDFAKRNAQNIKKKLGEITPKGTTPIALTLEKAARDFPDCSTCRNIIILITDGIEECDGDPCAISRALQKRGVILKPFVIGIGLDEDFKNTFKCIGNYYDASNEQVFKNVLNIVVSQALNNTTAQVNLLDIDGDPTETNVNMTFYNRFTQQDDYNYIHTLNSRGLPDTIFIDPSTEYDLVVHTLPQVKKEGVTLKAGQHNIIAVDAPQGFLELKKNGVKSFDQPNAIIRKHGEMQTIHVQELGSMEKYLVGKYDLEILTLPRTYIEGVEVLQSHTTEVEIPPAGLLTLTMNQPGYGSIYKIENNQLTWVVNLKPNTRSESFDLQPGNYKVVFRPGVAMDTKFTREKTFKITSGASEMVKL